MMQIYIDGMLAVAGTLCLSVVSVALYAWSGLPPTLLGAIALIFVPILIAAGCGMLLWRGQRESKTVFVFCLISAIVGAYTAEAYVGFLSSKEDARISNRTASMRESISAVVARYRSIGVNAYPALTPRMFLPQDSAARLQEEKTPTDSGSLLPLGGISNVKTVFCDEGGGMVVYDADEHGFRNPKGLWKQAPIDVLLLGDSYVHGACVDDAATFAATIRKKFPITINLGMAGNGPILNLAALREFGPHLKPRAIVWFFTIDNDFADLASERLHPILWRYLKGNIVQTLLSRQVTIDRALMAYIKPTLIKSEDDAASQVDLRSADHSVSPSLAQRFKAFVTLNRLRNALGISFSEPRHDYRTLKAVLAAAQDLASSWGGKIFLVFLPSSNSYVGVGRFDRTVLIVKNRLRDLAGEIGIAFLDGQKVFDAASHDEALFYGLGSHYTPKGQQLIGGAVQESLARCADCSHPR